MAFRVLGSLLSSQTGEMCTPSGSYNALLSCAVFMFTVTCHLTPEKIMPRFGWDSRMVLSLSYRVKKRQCNGIIKYMMLVKLWKLKAGIIAGNHKKKTLLNWIYFIFMKFIIFQMTYFDVMTRQIGKWSQPFNFFLWDICFF